MLPEEKSRVRTYMPINFSLLPAPLYSIDHLRVVVHNCFVRQRLDDADKAAQALSKPRECNLTEDYLQIEVQDPLIDNLQGLALQDMLEVIS